ncbi:MAG: peptide ABC transporter substrate-binding protein [Gammaproteobacteria bacterium]|nr:peptide ABC transporter substrate-binding protein [Gammaproteobacteria bacterium]
MIGLSISTMMCRPVGLGIVLVGLMAASNAYGARAMEHPWNSPYQALEASTVALYTVFQERPKHLDPVSSYSENEAQFTAQIYEPPLQYHFLKRPYQLIPLTATDIPQPQNYAADGQLLTSNAPDSTVARVVYRITIQPGIMYAPHPAFAEGAKGNPYYLEPGRSLPRFDSLDDFSRVGTRELVAADYVHQIKRLAHPHLHSPVAGFLSTYILGLNELSETLLSEHGDTQGFLDLRRYELPGARVVNRYTFEIVLQVKYPQFVYWLAMPFFAPVPWEVEAFYALPGMAARNINLDWHPLGTGPYMLRENNPNRRMVLVRNPNYRGEPYPREGEFEDVAQGWLRSAGTQMPFIDEIHFMLEKENIPEWNKFLQGYYDSSPIASDGFDQAIRFTPEGAPEVSPVMQQQGIHLAVATQPSVSYIGFNMLDPVVGGASAQARCLRQALAVAIDIEEMISIFNNGRGVTAHSPLPPGIFGYREGREGMNPVTHEWRDGRPQRKPLAVAQRLLSKAGYPSGVNPQTGDPLTLYLDATTTGPDMKSLFNWYRKQFQKLGIELVVRSTDYNRFQDKMRKGDAQIFNWGWNADYTDPENFLFLLYSRNGKAKYQGENAANYENPRFDALFERMRSLPNSPARQQLINELLAIARHDAPWIWGFHPQAYTLNHQWVGNTKPNMMARNTLKYRTLDPALRAAKQLEWNRPRLVPPLLAIALFLCPLLVVLKQRRKRLAILQ